MIRKTTITDIITEEGKQPQVTEITNDNRRMPEGFKKQSELTVPKCGRINFKHQILPYLLEKGAEAEKCTANATATIAIATDGNGNVCLRCRELTCTKARE